MISINEEGETIYSTIEVVASSPNDWEDTARNAIAAASESLRDLRIAEVKEFDVKLDDKGKVVAFRAKMNLSFRYEK